MASRPGLELAPLLLTQFSRPAGPAASGCVRESRWVGAVVSSRHGLCIGWLTVLTSCQPVLHSITRKRDACREHPRPKSGRCSAGQRQSVLIMSDAFDVFGWLLLVPSARAIPEHQSNEHWFVVCPKPLARLATVTP